ncbi:MAG: ferric reductase [Nocardioides sp.]|uniref:ferric reductase n=1 Tax=Nocardioides sp. TaxID=35761 RepID=UPI0039E2B52C
MTTWYLIRALGLVSLLALTATTCLGALATVGSRRPDAAEERLLRQLVHRSVAVLGLALLALHIALAVLDAYVSIPVWAVAVPLASGYRPVAVALGTLALYAFVTAAVSGWSRGRMAGSPGGARAWRALHLTAYAGWGLSMAHGIFTGTDTATWWAIATYAACGLLVTASVLARLGVRRRRLLDPRGHLVLNPGALR